MTRNRSNRPKGQQQLTEECTKIFDESHRNTLGPSTLAAHAGDDPHRYHGAVSPPIFETSLFAFEDFDACIDRFTGRTDDYVYTRGRNPTVEAAEVKVAALEGGESAKFFSSGMAAISAVLLSQLKPAFRTL